MRWRHCRICKQQADDSRLVKYAVRHYAHFRCYLEAGKSLADLSSWQVSLFPARILKDHELLEQTIAAAEGRIA